MSSGFDLACADDYKSAKVTHYIVLTTGWEMYSMMMKSGLYVNSIKGKTVAKTWA